MLWLLLAEAVESLGDMTRRLRFSQDREVLRSTAGSYAAQFGHAALIEVIDFYENLFHDAVTHMAVNWREHKRAQKRSARDAAAAYPQLMAAFSRTGPHVNDYRPVTVRPGLQVPRCVLLALNDEPTEEERMTIMTLALGKVLAGDS